MMGKLLRLFGIVYCSFVWNYRGHNRGMFCRGVNWWQVTIPPSRKHRRCALIVVTERAFDERQQP
jgi:hypothetical protein